MMRVAVCLGTLLALSGCGLFGASDDIESSCTSDKDCSAELSCELVVLGYFGYLDTGGDTEQVCTMSCQSDADCPETRIESCGKEQATCIDSYCRQLSVCD